MAVDQSPMNTLITEHIDIWTSAVKTKSTSGRGSSKKQELYGVKKLRELILELAVRGKLVPQDPSDEPASVLLERIAQEKAQLIKDKKIKRSKKLSPVAEEDLKDDLPLGWQVSRLGEFVSIIRGITFPASAKHNEPESNLIACLRTANVQTQLDWDDLIYVERSYVKREEQMLAVGDIVMSMANSRELVGKVSYTYFLPKNLDVSFGGFLSVIRPYQLDSAFLMMVLRSPSVRDELVGSSSQTTNIANISLEKLNPLVVSIPPLKEQHRIVAKVDELMALCDQLEQQTEASIEAHQVLVTTLLDSLLLSATTAEGSLTNSANAEDNVTAKSGGNVTDIKNVNAGKNFEQNWQMIADHFDTLFTTEESIEQLKQTILQLAVIGKLVPWSVDAQENELKKYLSFGPRNGFSPKEAPTETDVSVLKLGATTYGYLDLGQTKYVDIKVRDDSHLWLRKGDILIQRGNSANYVGCNCLVKMDVAGVIYPDLMMKLRTVENLNPEFLSIWLSSPKSRQFMWDRMTGTSGTMPKISKKIVESIPIIVPSTAEQALIVNRVNELMALCDRLKARLSDAQITQIHLTDAFVEQAI
ncbi:restriction endonuclease subunit S [Shewanella halotolerans]|uniref:restriction endonuclease subunit S n=1 Tax=Shewanella halotolerans TaxID=2864204 RepID=UPI001C65FA5F|nr:restriction endonuclease subunit S [Shewanella halotolerans]QYJ88844.1 restriction endonuclease subunit S [Shewanella halotolerans]